MRGGFDNATPPFLKLTVEIFIFFLYMQINTHRHAHTHKQTLLAIPLLISELEQKNSSLDKCFYKVIFSQYKA